MGDAASSMQPEQPVAPAPPKAAESRASFRTPSKRSPQPAERGGSDGPAKAIKRRRQADRPAEPPPRDVTCAVCLDPVASAVKPGSCGHLLCQTCAHGLWCCSNCRDEMMRSCPSCRTDILYGELQGDGDADKAADAEAKQTLDPAALKAWRQRKKDGKSLFARARKGGNLALAISEEKDFTHALIVSQSPSGRGSCAACDEGIAKGGLRVHRADGRFSHTACHDVEAELQQVCAGERVGLGEIFLNLEANIVDPQLMRNSRQAVRSADPEEMRLLRLKLTTAAGNSQWFWHIERNIGNIWSTDPPPRPAAAMPAQLQAAAAGLAPLLPELAAQQLADAFGNNPFEQFFAMLDENAQTARDAQAAAAAGAAGGGGAMDAADAAAVAAAMAAPWQ